MPGFTIPTDKSSIFQRLLLNEERFPNCSFLDVYDNVGSNGIFGANPSVVKFAGFEPLRTHTLKVRLINNSPAPQRLHILPP